MVMYIRLVYVVCLCATSSGDSDEMLSALSGAALGHRDGVYTDPPNIGINKGHHPDSEI